MDQAGKLQVGEASVDKEKSRNDSQQGKPLVEATRASVALSEGLCGFWWSQWAVMGV